MNEWLTTIVGMIGALAFMVIHPSRPRLEQKIEAWFIRRKERRDFPRAKVRRG